MRPITQGADDGINSPRGWQMADSDVTLTEENKTR